MARDYKHGDMVVWRVDAGIYMVIGPYVGERAKGDPKGPAFWVIDIDTEYMYEGGASQMWVSVDELSPVDE